VPRVRREYEDPARRSGSFAEAGAGQEQRLELHVQWRLRFAGQREKAACGAGI